MFSQMLPLSTPTAPPPHRDTIFMSSQSLVHRPPMEMDKEQLVEASEASLFLLCVSVFPFMHSRGDRSRASYQLATDNPDHRERDDR